VKLHPAAIGAIALVVSAVCLAAGFWQLSRLGEKRELNAALAAALAATPEPLGVTDDALARQAGHKVVAQGIYDESRHVLLSARFHDGELGVEVLTPLFYAPSGALLVDRGWMPAEDGQTTRPESLSASGANRVTGLLEKLPARANMPPWRRLESEGVEHWSTHELDSASVASHPPYPLAPYLLVALPDSGAPAEPVRTGPPMFDELVHLSYAIQWFVFALVTMGGMVTIVLRRRAAGDRASAPRP
jgi:cytochrome oxidase assembly protein ShyY1